MKSTRLHKDHSNYLISVLIWCLFMLKVTFSNKMIDLHFNLDERFWTTTSPFDNVAILKPDVFIMHWAYNETEITFEIHAKEAGWISFGLSLDGSVSDSDIIIAWINQDGTGHFSDCHYESQPYPIQDKIQNWVLLQASLVNNTTVLKFSRKLIVCDSNELNINVSKSNFITYSIGNLPKTNRPGLYHETFRGSELMKLIPDGLKIQSHVRKCIFKQIKIANV